MLLLMLLSTVGGEGLGYESKVKFTYLSMWECNEIRSTMISEIHKHKIIRSTKQLKSFKVFKFSTNYINKIVWQNKSFAQHLCHTQTSNLEIGLAR